MLLGTLGASLLGDMLAGKGIVKAGYGSKGEGIIRAKYGSKQSKKGKGFLLKDFRYNPILDGVYSRDNLPDKIKNGAYVINLDEYSDIGTHWIALYIVNDNVTYFDSFGVEHIPTEIKKIIKRSTIVTNIFRM